jgi:hypothetical protein
MTVYGYSAAYPQLSGRDQQLTPTGQSAVQQVTTFCTVETLTTFAGRTEAEYGVGPVLDAPDFRQALVDNDPGHRKTDVPIFLVHGEADDTIPVANTRDLVDRYCHTGVQVTANFYAGRGHVDVLFAALRDVSRFVDDRFAGKPAQSTCPAGS